MVGRCRIPAGLWRQMREAPVLEVTRPLQQRLDALVAIYGSQDAGELAAATRRISRRLGPQRTAGALAAIERSDWAGACAEILDYYDRCYDHDLEGRERTVVDLGDLQAPAAALRLLRQGLVGAPP
jgi:tRNA 2-selenouridine synthase